MDHSFQDLSVTPRRPSISPSPLTSLFPSVPLSYTSTCRSQSTSESTVLFSVMTVTPFYALKLVWALRHLCRHTILSGWCSLSTHTYVLRGASGEQPEVCLRLDPSELPHIEILGIFLASEFAGRSSGGNAASSTSPKYLCKALNGIGYVNQ